LYDATTEILEIGGGSDGVTVTQVTAPTNGGGPQYVDARGVRDACLMASSIVIDSVPFE
jgi:hypothetical protein